MFFIRKYIKVIPSKYQVILSTSVLSFLMALFLFGEWGLAERGPQGYTKPINDELEVVVTTNEEERFNVSYEVKDTDIYVECVIRDFTFSKENIGSKKVDGEGHIQLYINGQKVDSLFQPSFIIKNLPSGTYDIKLELVHNDYSPYGLIQEFNVKL